MTNIKGAIFDVDGTLLDSMPAWDEVAFEFLRSRGAVPRADLREALRPLGGHQVPGYFRTEYGINEPEVDITDALNRLLEDCYFHKAPLKDGVLEVLESFRRCGIKMCVATATGRRLVEPALERCGVLGYFGRVFSCGEEKTSKSSPEIFIRAAAFLGTGVSETIVFEDALYAIESAKKAGFPVAAVYDFAEDDRQEEIKRLSDYYFVSLRDCPWVD